MDAILKATTLIGLVLLLGAGVFARWIGADVLTPLTRRYLTVGLLAGGALILVGSSLELAVTAARILRGRFDLGIYLEYLVTTRHGQAVLVRSSLTLLLMAWGTHQLVSPRSDRLAHGLAGLLLLGTVSLISHSGTMGAGPFLADLAHLVSTAVWGGTLCYLAVLPIWREHQRLALVVQRLSSVGLASVGLLLATGLYMSLVHLERPQQLIETTYGLSLVAKLLLVLVIIALAAVNRWVFVPLLEQHGQSRPLQRAVRTESLPLAGVLVATGVLTTREPPHEHTAHPQAAQGAPVDPHVHAPRQEATPPPHHLALEAGTLILGASEEGGLVVRLEHSEPARVSLEAISPSGSFGLLTTLSTAEPRAVEGLTLQPQQELHAALPSEETGVWRLLGEVNDQVIGLSITIEESETPSGLAVTLVLIPTPSLTGQGQTRAFISLHRNGEAVAPAVSASYEMPDMEHATQVRHLASPPAREHSGMSARSTRLSFPMVGVWEVALTTRDERVVLPIEVLAD